MSIYGVLPQSVANDINLSTSLNQWLYQQVKLAYDTASAAKGLNNGYQMTKEGTWVTDNNGMYIFEGTGPTDPKLFERLPCIMYQIDDIKGAKTPQPLGCGDQANWEWIPILLCCVPPPLIAEDGSSEPDILSRAVLKTCLRNAILRQYKLPIVDGSQSPSGSPTPLYPVVGFADIQDQRLIAMPDELKQMMINKRERFDVTFTIRWPVVYSAI